MPNPAVVASARSTADAIAQALGSSTVVELDAAVDLTSPVPAGAPPDAGQASLVHPITVPGRGQGWTQVATPYVATPAVLDLYRIPAADIAAGSDILSSRRDLSGIELGTGFKADFQPVTVQVSALLPNYTSAPNTLITPKAMTAGGYTAEPVGWLVQAQHPITAAQITDARHRAAAAGITIETRTGPDQHPAAPARLLDAGRRARRARRAGHDRRADPQRDRRRPAHAHRDRREQRHPAHAERDVRRRAGPAGRNPRHRRGLPRTDRLALARRQLPQPAAVRRTWPS